MRSIAVFADSSPIEGLLSWLCNADRVELHFSRLLLCVQKNAANLAKLAENTAASVPVDVFVRYPYDVFKAMRRVAKSDCEAKDLLSLFLRATFCVAAF